MYNDMLTARTNAAGLLGRDGRAAFVAILEHLHAARHDVVQLGATLDRWLDVPAEGRAMHVCSVQEQRRSKHVCEHNLLCPWLQGWCHASSGGGGDSTAASQQYQIGTV